jgi:hypothetical protein
MGWEGDVARQRIGLKKVDRDGAREKKNPAGEPAG